MTSWPVPEKLCQNAAPPVGDPTKMDLTGLVMEPKLDGFRLLAHRTATGVDTYTRTGKKQNGKLPHIEAALMALPEGTWLDGELVAFDGKGFPDWGKVQTIMGANITRDQTKRASILTYVVFDMLAYATLDIRPLPLSERRAALLSALQPLLPSRMVIDVGGAVRDIITVADQCPASHAFHDSLIELGMEGTIVKDPTKPYASGKRGHGWTKFKMNDEMDVVIMGFKPGENSFSGLIGAIEFGQYREQDWCTTCANDPAGHRHLCPDRPHHQVLVSRGRCSGMTMKQRVDFTNRQQELVDNQQVISLAYMGIMPSGSPRHPQFKRLRMDKSAADCTWTG